MNYIILLMFSFIFIGCNSDHSTDQHKTQNYLEKTINSFDKFITSLQDPSGETQHVTVKVAVVYQNPRIPSEGGKRLHEIFGFNDPIELNRIYKDSMEAFTYNNVTYEIVKVIDEDRMWTRFKDSTNYLTKDRVYELLSEPNFTELKERDPRFDYEGFVKHYDFGELRDQDKINEVWVWSWPVAGMWESQQVGQNAFWCNSTPIFMDNEKILTIMGFNYERTADLAMHSFGHRAESVMKKVYNRWEPLKDVVSPNNWELFTSLDKDTPGKGHVGNCHFPVNGQSDYDYSNEKQVNSYAHVWRNYPTLNWEEATPKIVECADWGCNQMGYMSWWYRKFPHAGGVNIKDKKLNNWWHYVVNYESAIELENQLNGIN